ncbi:MAG TPA: hypothetical protein VK528_08340 [Flavobacterium sp.]|nr:hypothetical protein [Flavobacterium sp.]
MKKLPLLSILFLSALAVSCSKDDDNNATEVQGPPVNSETVDATNFKYKQFFQETESESTRKGIVILAHGDDADENDYTLNDQCVALAQQGYVAITTSYEPISGTVENQNATFKSNIEEVIAGATADFDIPRSKVIIGGLSRGGNSTFALVLPAQAGITPITGNKGVILQCSGGDEWKGSAILFPTAYMSNKTDDVMGVPDTNVFKNGLAANANPGVASMSECLIIDGVGHCGAANYYKPFIVQKVMQWLP